jgi:16S rRNA (adenine1518-N6/adenine1519-N6)-dimethyltransferase
MADDLNPKPLSLAKQTREWLRQYELHAKKGLGQHFLVNSGILSNIISAAELSPQDLVIEVGPGLGVLTRELLNNAGYVIAVELDSAVIKLLQSNLAGYDNFSLIHSDILKIKPGEIIEREKHKFPASVDPQRYKVVANLPYYITQPIIRHFCEAAVKPQSMVIMVQKEVAKNIIAKPGDLSILAVSVQLYGKPRIMGSVPAGNFYPPPKVDSAILRIDLYPQPAVPVTSIDNFFRVVKAGFSSARKQIVNSLAQGLEITKPEVISLLDKAGILPQKRPEMLTLEEWSRLEKYFEREERK